MDTPLVSGSLQTSKSLGLVDPLETPIASKKADKDFPPSTNPFVMARQSDKEFVTSTEASMLLDSEVDGDSEAKGFAMSSKSSQRPDVSFNSQSYQKTSSNFESRAPDVPFFAQTVSPDNDIRSVGRRRPALVDPRSLLMETNGIDIPSMIDSRGMNERIMKSLDGTGPSSTFYKFQKAEESWELIKQQRQRQTKPSVFVTQDVAVGNIDCWNRLSQQHGVKLDYDVVVLGGKLGIFYAAALQAKGYNVAVIETDSMQGREQEWNVSIDELLELVKLKLLTINELNESIATNFVVSRSAFKNKEITPLEGGYKENGVGFELLSDDAVNLGVSPSKLIQIVNMRFQERGGIIFENQPIRGVAISDSTGTAIDLGPSLQPITARLVIDCLGNVSPITKQQRKGQRPDGVCVVVGSCASGYDPVSNVVGDQMYSNQKIESKGPKGRFQYFWESFPVGIGENGMLPGMSNTKTTYMFTYMDADAKRPSLETIFEDYWKLLPSYQPSIQDPETDLDMKRVLFGVFPTYKDSPLTPSWNRLLAVGEAAGMQSPLSFGGLGTVTRHLDRITNALDEALQDDLLTKEDLGLIHSYSPALRATWMFHRAMSVKSQVDPEFVNRFLAINLEAMNTTGSVRPFLNNVICFDGLASTIAASSIKDPALMPQMIQHVGVVTLIEWLGHLARMGQYSVCDTVAGPLLASLTGGMKDARKRFAWRRQLDAWKYGCGNDFQSKR